MSNEYTSGVSFKFLNEFVALEMLGKKYSSVIFYEIWNDHYLLPL